MKKTTTKRKMMEDKTKSKIPKTERQKKMWIQARRIAAKESGKYSEKDMPWGLVTKIYKNEKGADKVAKNKDWMDAKKSKAVSKYSEPDRRTRNERKRTRKAPSRTQKVRSGRKKF